MALGKRILLFSARDPNASSLSTSVAEWGCLTSTCNSLDELRGRIEGADFDLLLVEPASALRRLVGDPDTAPQLDLPLAEVEKRHIQRVVASTGGNKTRAARILGIDTKTLYNKLKAYQNAEQIARKRAQLNGTLSTSAAAPVHRPAPSGT